MDTIPPFIFILTLLVAVGLMAMGLFHRRMVRCSSCHKRWPSRFSFCPQCGTMLPHAHHEQTIRLPNDRHGTRGRTRGKMALLSEERSEQFPGDLLYANPQRYHAALQVRPLCHSCWQPLQQGDRFCGQCGSTVPLRKKRRY